MGKLLTLHIISSPEEEEVRKSRVSRHVGLLVYIRRLKQAGLNGEAAFMPLYRLNLVKQDGRVPHHEFEGCAPPCCWSDKLTDC